VGFHHGVPAQQFSPEAGWATTAGDRPGLRRLLG